MKLSYSKHEAAQVLGIRDETLDHLISTGEIVGRYLGSEYAISATELNNFAERKFGIQSVIGSHPVHVQED